jgi:hypothetical protein
MSRNAISPPQLVYGILNTVHDNVVDIVDVTMWFWSLSSLLTVLGYSAVRCIVQPVALSDENCGGAVQEEWS